MSNKDGEKIPALVMLSNYMSFEKTRTIFTESQFGYCQLKLMLYGRQASWKINHIHKRAVHVAYETEAVNQWYSRRIAFFKISRNSQGNTYDGVFF